MAPIHETDRAEERWTKAEWEHYELWEKVEHKHRRRTRRWLIGAVTLFAAISSIPVLQELLPKWGTRSVARRIAQEVVAMQVQVGQLEAPLRISLTAGESGVPFKLERVASCAPGEPAIQLLKSGNLGPEQVTTVSGEVARGLGLEHTVSEFCYDPRLGSLATTESLQGIVVGNVKDLALARTDRFSVVLLSGNSAEITFD